MRRKWKSQKKRKEKVRFFYLASGITRIPGRATPIPNQNEEEIEENLRKNERDNEGR